MQPGIKVGFVVPGRAGRSAAGNLIAAGYQLAVCDLDPAAARDCLDARANLEPPPPWDAVRHGATGQRRTFDGLGAEFLTRKYEKPGFPLRLMQKNVELAVALDEKIGIPLHIAHYTPAELNAARERGWGNLASRVAMRLQLERADVAEPADSPEQVSAVPTH